MEMLVNTHAELTTVKGKVNQLFILQSQVNVDLILFPSVALLIFWRFFFFFFHTFTFFELYFWILCPGPPEINTELKNQSVAYNSSLQFICSLSGFPTPEILWTKDGVNLGNNNTLTIRQARFEDSGQYTCSANNSEGSKNSTFWIEVAGGTVLIYILKELESIINLDIFGWMRIKSFLWYHMQFKDLKPQKFQNWLKILKKVLNWW